MLCMIITVFCRAPENLFTHLLLWFTHRPHSQLSLLFFSDSRGVLEFLKRSKICCGCEKAKGTDHKGLLDSPKLYFLYSVLLYSDDFTHCGLLFPERVVGGC